MTTMLLLPDINVWLGMAFASHIHHATAKSWFDGVPSDIVHFCRMTQQGFLRLATNPRVMREQAVSLSEAWRMYDAFLRDPRISFAAEPIGLDPIWRGYIQGESFTPKVWNDAFLAAFAEAGGYELITFDKGFTRYANVKCTILS
jgi:uncharacterized protein